MSAKRFLLIDSSGILHKQFHGAPAKHGQVDSKYSIDVGALFGYVNHLAKRIYGEHSSLDFDKIIHVLDNGGSKYREGIYPEYKQNRPPTHPALLAQKNLLEPTLQAIGETTLSKKGVEADDLVGTLAKKLVEDGHIVAIISNDKDLLQLVRDGETVIAQDKKDKETGFNSYGFLTEKEVTLKMGVHPYQIIDYLALVGDKSDNIPGVNLVGPKKASKLLNTYGTIDEIIKHSGDIPGKVGSNIRKAIDDGSLPLCRLLTTIDRDIPIDSFYAELAAGRALKRNVDAAKAAHDMLGLDESIPYFLHDTLEGNKRHLDMEGNQPQNATSTAPEQPQELAAPKAKKWRHIHL